jgi:hypothetical protein
VQALESEQAEKMAHVQKLERTTKEELWSEDLDGFEAAYQQWLKEEDQALAELADAARKARKRNNGKGVRVLMQRLLSRRATPQLSSGLADLFVYILHPSLDNVYNG